MTLTFLSQSVNVHKDNLLRHLKLYALKNQINFKIDEISDEIEFKFDDPEYYEFDTKKLKEDYFNLTSIQNEHIRVNSFKK